MAPFPDHDETQAVDSLPPDDPIPMDETQPIDPSTEDYNLYRETQALEEEEEVVHSIDEWIKTQDLDMDDEIQEQEVSEKKGTILTDSDASTDGGGSVRSFTSVRTASLRSSGLAAARSFTPKAVDVEPKSSFGNSENFKSPDNDVDGLPGAKSSGMETPKCAAHLIIHGIGVVDIAKDIEIEDPHESMQKDHGDERKSRMCNPRVKKLLYEDTHDETITKPDSLTGKLDSPCLLVPDCAVAGLSYIDSQEPGDLSQANALDVVDKFISVHDLGLSQETNTGKTDMVKSPPISSAKGAQILAKNVDHRSPVGKTATFEWIDSQEDEGGGEFFSRRKDSFFECKVAAQKSLSQPPKSKQFNSSLASETVHKSGKKPFKIPIRQTTLTRSDSRLMQHRSFRNKRVHVSKTRTKKNLFEDLNKQTNSPSLEQQLELNDNGRDVEGTYEVGPDTQMAAEAMEALIHGTNYDKNDANEVAGKSTNICSEGAAMKKTSSKRTILRNSTSSIPNTEGVSTRAKRRLLPTKSRTGSPRFSRCKSQKGNSLDFIAGKMKEKRENKKRGQLVNGSSMDKIGSSASVKGRKEVSLLKETINQEVDKCHSSLTLNVQLSLSKENTLCEFHLNSTPVAHRTRHAKAVKSSNQAEALASGSGRNSTGLIGVRTRRAIAREGKLAADVSKTLTMKRKSTDIKSNEDAIIERLKPNDVEQLHDEEPKSSSLVKDVATHPKRRRTCKITSESTKVNGDMNNPSVSLDTIQLRIQHGQIKGTIKSVSEILDTATRKKRSVFINLASEIDGMASNGKKVTFKSMVERASPKSVSTKPGLDDCSNECLATPVLYRSDSFGAANPCSTPLKQVGDLVSHDENEGDNAKLEGSLREGLHPSDQTCTTPSKGIDAVSPVCVAQNCLRVSGNKGRRSGSSITRKLIRLEACEASPTGTFNTRRRKDMASVHVLFSHHLDDDIIKQQKKIMGRLGVALASSMSDATHFVTDKFVRTRNMLEAMSMGKPVVTYMWLESCGQTNCFIDEKNYILRDAKKEKEIGFSMPVSLARAYRSPLLQGKRVYITPNTKPDLELLSSLVKSAHGQPLERIGRSALRDEKLPDDILVISCEEDYAICMPLLEKGAEIYSSELLLNGIVIQKLEYERHVLFLDHVRRTRSTLWLRHKDGDQFLPVSKCT